jgi:hypothetical protein
MNPHSPRPCEAQPASHTSREGGAASAPSGPAQDAVEHPPMLPEDVAPETPPSPADLEQGSLSPLHLLCWL